MTYSFTKEDLDRVYSEIERRVINAVCYGACDPADEKSLRSDMLQGMYSTLIMLADNWMEVRHLTDVIEEERWGEAYV